MKHLLIRLTLACLSGGLTFLAVQPLSWWPMGILGIALLYGVLTPWGSNAPTLRVGASTAFAHGFVLYLLTLPWIGELVGSFPYVALAFWLALYLSLIHI